MGTKSNPGVYDCYENAHPDEPMFVLLGRDKLAGALVRLWADMREREGDDPQQAAEARQVAEDLDKWCTDLGKPVVSNDALLSFVNITRGQRAAEASRQPVEQYNPVVTWNEGEHAMTLHSRDIGVFEQLIEVDGQPPYARVRYSATQAPTIPLSSLRKPTREELDAYYSKFNR
jgi:hypothetical protein